MDSYPGGSSRTVDNYSGHFFGYLALAKGQFVWQAERRIPLDGAFAHLHQA